MARSAPLVAAALALCLLLAPPGLAWYRPAAGPGSYSVGRAAGLLSGFRRSPHARRSEPPGSAGPPGRASAVAEPRPRLRSLAACVKDVSPKLRSCTRFPDGRATVQCQADVFLSLRAAACRSA
ncbi:neuropeptide B [Mustela erminea]|uniref:neuropeptide B n=1 Tax=Mustela erminea TaxID=36723 RepID=UPI001386815B|nr:neuropeptide B [Mustela erminea]